MPEKKSIFQKRKFSFELLTSSFRKSSKGVWLIYVTFLRIGFVKEGQSPFEVFMWEQNTSHKIIKLFGFYIKKEFYKR